MLTFQLKHALIQDIILKGLMEIEVTMAQKKSIILWPKHQGDVKVVLAKHYLSYSNGKEIDDKANPAKVDFTSTSSKRKSFESAGTIEINEQCQSGKRRRSVQLTGTLKPTVPLVKDLVKNKTSSHDVNKNIFCMQRTNEEIQTSQSKGPCESAVEVVPSRIHANESSVNVSKTNQQHDKMINYAQDCILLPDWLEKKNAKVLQLFPNVNSPDFKNTVKCKSLFETYQFNKVRKSIVDEI